MYLYMYTLLNSTFLAIDLSPYITLIFVKNIHVRILKTPF